MYLFQFPYLPCSVNDIKVPVFKYQKQRRGFLRLGLSEKYRESKKKFEKDLLEYALELIEIHDYFNPKYHVLQVSYYFLSPKFLKKDETISKKGGDVNNFPKSVEDALHNSLGIDDAFNIGGTVKKIPFEYDRTIILLDVIDLNSYRLQSESLIEMLSNPEMV